MVETSIMPIGFTNINIQINVSEFISKLSFTSVLVFNRVESWKEGKTSIFVGSSFQIPQKNTGFILKVNVCQCKHVFS